MASSRKCDPLHGMTREMILARLVEQYGGERRGRSVDIRCFTNDPSIKSSLQFLRKTPWVKKKVEGLYFRWLRDSAEAVK